MTNGVTWNKKLDDHNYPAAASYLNLIATEAVVSWGNYGGYAFHYIADLAGHRGNHTRNLFTQHAAGQLPTVSWLYSDGRPDLSEHPTQNVTDGMNWSLQQIQAMIDGVLWDKTKTIRT